jgi:hypothetical protein
MANVRLIGYLRHATAPEPFNHHVQAPQDPEESDPENQ